MSNPVIAFNNTHFKVSRDKFVTHSVGSIYVDSFAGTVKVAIESKAKGNVEVVTMTMDQAERIGFINIEALKDYCK